MSVKKYMLMDLIVLNILYIIAGFSSKYLFLNMNSTIYFSFQLLIQGIIIIRWGIIGSLSNFIAMILLAIINKIVMGESFLIISLEAMIILIFVTLIAIIIDGVIKKKEYPFVIKLFIYITIFLSNAVGDVISKLIYFNTNLIDLFKNYIFIQSLSVFATILLLIILNNHQNLFSKQIQNLKMLKRGKKNE